jgi:hypothetical protein
LRYYPTICLEELRKPMKNLNHDDYCPSRDSLNIIRIITSRRIKWVRHVAHMEGGREMLYMLVGKYEGK